MVVRQLQHARKITPDYAMHKPQGVFEIGSHNNHLFVLDGSAQQVRVFDPNGEFVESFGGLGDGPEEMRGAYAIVAEQEGDVLVFGTGRHIKVFRPTPAGYRFSEHRPLPISGGMACITASGRLIVAGADTRTDRNVVLHEIPRRAAEPVRSFGLGYRDSSAFIRFMVANRGPVACTEYEGRDVVLHAFVPLSFVRLLDVEDGAVLWVARLVDHQQLVMTGDATSLTQDPTTEWDIIVTLLPYHDHYALLQAERFEPITPAKARTMSGPPRGTVHTYLLDIPSGRGASVAVGLVQVMATNRARYAVVTIDPGSCDPGVGQHRPGP
ncbi:MAG: 6-bladed beta-propeller [Gemmatimonadota bacterium]|nr:6-bladed beta-propeller [Gemmatimonadota bacterium]